MLGKLAAFEGANVATARAGVVINEVMALNSTTIADEDGDFGDWIELLNTGSAPLDLNGYGLSDDASRPFKWRFGNRTIQPGEFLIVFATEKDRRGETPATNPLDIPGLAMWLSAEDIDPADRISVRAEGDRNFVGKWRDRSPRGTDAKQTTASRQPELIIDGASNRKTVRFDGINDFLSLGTVSNLHDGNNVTIVAVIRALGLLNRPTLFSTRRDNAARSFALEFTPDGRITLSTPGVWNLETPPGAVAADRTALLTYWRDSDRLQAALVDGVQQRLTIDDAQDFLPNASEKLIGAGLALNSFYSFHGDIAELLIYDRALSTDQRRAVEWHLATKHELDYRHPEIHTNFKISSTGEELHLTAPSGELVDYIVEKEVLSDISVGRQPDGSGVLMYFQEPTPNAPNTSEGFKGILRQPVFSHAAGVHAAPFQLEISTGEPGAVIYYTTDGSLPSPGNLAGSTYRIKNAYPDGPLITRTNFTRLYEGRISIDRREAGPEDLSLINTDVFHYPLEPFVPREPPFKGTIIRVVAVKPGFLPSPVAHATFFIDPALNKRYSLPVVSIIADEKGLFDYETGIFVPGKPFSDWMSANPAEPLSWMTPANYFMSGGDWERRAHIEFFEPDGALPVQQEIGFRIHGKSTRTLPRKPLRIYARSEFGADLLDHEFFPGLRARGQSGQIVNQFNTLLLRSEFDQGGAYFYRDALLQKLIEPLGTDVQAYRPVVHFINGEYWGIVSMQERYDEHYLASHYGIDPADAVIIENAFGAVLNVGLPSDRYHYLSLREYVSTNDMSLSAHYEHVKTQMDVTNFASFQATHIYLAASDWGASGNNTRFWRKRTRGFVPDAPYGHDGRWRWMTYDMGSTLTSPAINSLSLAIGSIPPLILFTRLLDNQEFKRIVINTFADMMNTIFQPERFKQVAQAVYSELAPELREHNARWNGNIGPHPTAFAEERPGYMRQHLIETFELGGTATITLDVSDETRGKIQINSLLLDKNTTGIADPPYPWTGIYFKDVPITIRAIPEPGFRFAGWSLALPKEPELVLALSGDLSLTALFERDPHVLAGGAYVFDSWDEGQPAGTYPPHIVFFQTRSGDPGLGTEMEEVWNLPYNLTSRSRINGLGEDGFAFINTSSPQELEGAGYVGAATLTLDTVGRREIRVSWTGGTIVANSRVYGIRLQYRVGSQGPFLDVLDALGNPVEYRGKTQAPHFQTIGPVVLPDSANDQPYVELRWRYYYIGGDSGARPQLSVGHIRVSAGDSEPHQLRFAQVPKSAQTGRQMEAVVVQIEAADGAPAAGYNGLVEISAGEDASGLSGTVRRQASGGIVVFDDLVFLRIGPQTLTVRANGLVEGISREIAVVEVTDLIMPLYLQGEESPNLNRLPFAYRLRLAGLKPNARYRYGNSIVVRDDPQTQDGAGNMIIVRDGGNFVRNTDAPRFRPDDLYSRHGEFVTDSEGRHSGWFLVEPTGSARTVPGNTVFMRLLLNDGNGGEEFFHVLTSASPVEVIAFGPTPGQGSAVYAISAAADRNFVVLYEDWTGAGRPVAAAAVESTGAEVDMRYAGFYRGSVAGQTGRWGTLLPNRLPSGVRRIEERNLAAGELVSLFASPEGIHPTRDLRSGTNAVGILVPGPRDNEYVAWRSRHFTVEQLADEAVSGPASDPDADQLPNAIEFALGVSPWERSDGALPEARIEEAGGQQYLVFRHRRLIGVPFVEYIVELTEDLRVWREPVAEWERLPVEPTGDGMTEMVTLRLPIEDGSTQKFLRLRVRFLDE